MEGEFLTHACLSVLFLTLLGSAAAWGQDADLTMAYVQDRGAGEPVATGDHGNAWLFHRGGVCYAVLPRHVLVNPDLHLDYRYAELKVARAGQPMPPAQADRCAIFDSVDLALMRVTGVESLSDCGDVLVGLPSVDSELAREAPVTLTVATEFSQLQGIPLRLRSVGGSDSSIFHVQTADPGFELTGGMSGGVIVGDDGTLMGMLLRVPVNGTPASRADARALRFDRIAALLARYFTEPASVATVDHPGCDVPPPARAMAEVKSGRSAILGGRIGSNRADLACGAAVIGWSVPALAPQFRPDNLVGQSGDQATWRASADGEATVDLQLCPGNTVSEVRLDHSRCASGDDRGTMVEVLVRSGPDAGFTSVGYGSIAGPAALDVRSGVPMIGQQLRLRFVATGRQTLCAGPLEVR